MRSNISIFILAAVLLISCNKDDLSPIPQTALSDLVAFQTPERVAQQVNGMYAAVKTGQFYGGRYIVYNEVRGEDHLNQTQNGVTGFQTWNFTVTPTTNEVQNLWGAAYQAINRINVVLQGLETSPISDALKNQYRGEARFLRGLTYFSLVTTYGRPFWDGNGDKLGVPLYLEPQTSSGSNDRARATVAQVYNQILDDLNFAETNLPANYSTDVLNKTRAHKNTAIAFKTRVLLNMRRYADVVTEANKIVSASAPFTATSGVQHSLNASVTGLYGDAPTGTEVIFGFPFTSLDLPGTQNSLNQYYSPSPGGNGDYSLNPAGIVANTGWTATDARRGFIGTSGTRTILTKFTSNTNFVPVIRYAEVLLNLAEALARTNTGVNVRALALVNAVRQRSAPAVVLVAATQTDLVNLILTERRIELLGEGLRALDIVRLGETFPAKGVAPSIAPNDAQYIWPIPLSELLVNKTAQQNPGY